MMRPSAICQGLVLCLVVSCGDRTIQSSATNTNEANVDGESPDAMHEGVPGDPWHCGANDATCVGPMGIGDCIDDECQGRLYSCSLDGTTCAELCADEGGVCAENRCEGATAYGWGLSSAEQSIDLCTLADDATATALTIGCDDPLSFESFPGLRCCCK